ncbi:hypothetical protein HanHA300_Chr03g0110121 [Helianthus annuus]|nr:hypothetical protein HanHA300_Chr03g0110121 [Helianthus annuus]
MINKQRIIACATPKAVRGNKSSKPSVPCTRGLLEPIERLFQPAHIVGKTLIIKSRRLMHENSLVKLPM